MATETKGVLGEKLGMTQVFDENNRIVPVTVVQAGPNVVTQVRTPDQDHVLHRVDCLDRQVLYGVPRVAHPARHPYPLEDTARGGAAAD